MSDDNTLIYLDTISSKFQIRSDLFESAVKEFSFIIMAISKKIPSQEDKEDFISDIKERTKELLDIEGEIPEGTYANYPCRIQLNANDETIHVDGNYYAVVMALAIGIRMVLLFDIVWKEKTLEDLPQRTEELFEILDAAILKD